LSEDCNFEDCSTDEDDGVVGSDDGEKNVGAGMVFATRIFAREQAMGSK